MRNTVIKTYSLIFFLFTTFAAFADNPEEVPEDLDGPSAPINDHIWLLILLGLAFVFLKYKSKKVQENS